jgi:hypothetical protein
VARRPRSRLDRGRLRRFVSTCCTDVNTAIAAGLLQRGIATSVNHSHAAGTFAKFISQGVTQSASDAIDTTCQLVGVFGAARAGRPSGFDDIRHDSQRARARGV